MRNKHYTLPVATIILSLFSMNSIATNTPKPTPTPVSSFNNNFNPSINAKINTNSEAEAYSNSKSLAIGQGGSGYSNAQGGNGGTGVGTANGFGGNIQNVGNSSFSSDIPRQAPMAYAPTPMLGGNPFKCNDSATFGASSPFGGVSLGIPLTEDNCPIFVMSQYLYSIGQPVQGCEILNNIPEIADVRKKTNFSCLQPVVAPVVAHDPNWLNEFNKKFPPIDNKLTNIHTDTMKK